MRYGIQKVFPAQVVQTWRIARLLSQVSQPERRLQCDLTRSPYTRTRRPRSVTSVARCCLDWCVKVSSVMVSNVTLCGQSGSVSLCCCCWTGCGLNFHKRCVVKVPNNCTLSEARRRRSSALLTVPRTPSDTGSNSSLASISDETGLVSRRYAYYTLYCITYHKSGSRTIRWLTLFCLLFKAVSACLTKAEVAITQYKGYWTHDCLRPTGAHQDTTYVCGAQLHTSHSVPLLQETAQGTF